MLANIVIRFRTLTYCHFIASKKSLAPQCSKANNMRKYRDFRTTKCKLHQNAKSTNELFYHGMAWHVPTEVYRNLNTHIALLNLCQVKPQQANGVNNEPFACQIVP